MNQKQFTVEETSNIQEILTTEIVEHLKLSRQIPSILTGLINRKIINQTAQREGIKISEEELQIAADRFRFEHKLISSKDTLKWLEQNHLSVTEFEELIKNNLVAQKLGKHLFEDQVEPYFYAHKLDYNQASIYEIVLTDFDLAMELFYGLQEQELSFWELSHKYIQDNNLRRHGGYKGLVTRKQLYPEMAVAVFAISDDDLPQVLKPMTIDKKTYLIYVEEIIHPVLNESLRQKIINKLYQSWLEKQRLDFAKIAISPTAN
jgi:parvulin-like peptidyl-prolyl isomerase